MVVACRRGLPPRPKAADKWGTITRAALSRGGGRKNSLAERRSPVDSRETRARSKLAINSGLTLLELVRGQPSKYNTATLVRVRPFVRSFSVRSEAKKRPIPGVASVWNNERTGRVLLGLWTRTRTREGREKEK